MELYALWGPICPFRASTGLCALLRHHGFFCFLSQAAFDLCPDGRFHLPGFFRFDRLAKLRKAMGLPGRHFKPFHVLRPGPEDKPFQPFFFLGIHKAILVLVVCGSCQKLFQIPEPSKNQISHNLIECTLIHKLRFCFRKEKI